MVVIRDATTADTSSLVSLDPLASAGEHGREEEIYRWMNAGNVRVADDDGDVLGYCVVERTFFRQGFVTLLMVVVHARRRGIGARLLGDASLRRPTDKLFTSTNLSNHPMQRLLDRSGWRSVGILYGLDDNDPELFYRAPTSA